MTTYPQDILAEGLNTLDLQGRGLGAQKSEEVTKLQKLHFNNSLNEEINLTIFGPFLSN